ncbi:MAG TPA: OmpA family protein [Crocinitomicaceae bacterium]|nr:OmpA family protein [Crocinitomicaceae bacterium]
MKNKFHFFTFLGLLFLAFSCAPVYKCGESRPSGFAAGNRLTGVVNERDELCELSKNQQETIVKLTENTKILNETIDSLNVKNQTLQGEYNTLNGKYKTLQGDHEALKEDLLKLTKNYNAAVTENLTQGHLYDERIKEKERRLAEREKELMEREKRIKELELEIARRDSIVKRLNQILQDALLGFDKDELSVEIKNGKVYISMSDKLMFQSGKSDVQEKGKTALESLVTVFAKNENFEILVEGHTDNIPIKTAQFSDNWDLSAARATAVVRILQQGGKINPNRLTASGKGEYEPKVANDTPENRAKNRRTEIILSPNLTELMEYLGK